MLDIHRGSDLLTKVKITNVNLIPQGRTIEDKHEGE